MSCDKWGLISECKLNRNIPWRATRASANTQLLNVCMFCFVVCCFGFFCPSFRSVASCLHHSDIRLIRRTLCVFMCVVAVVKALSLDLQLQWMRQWGRKDNFRSISLFYNVIFYKMIISEALKCSFVWYYRIIAFILWTWKSQWSPPPTKQAINAYLDCNTEVGWRQNVNPRGWWAGCHRLCL